MTRSLALPCVSPHTTSFKQRLALVGFALLLAACGIIDYDLEPKNMFAAPSKNKNIGVVHFHFADSSEPYEARVRRIKGGHALQLPMIDESTGDHMRFIASRTKNETYFVGIESRYAF